MSTADGRPIQLAFPTGHAVYVLGGMASIPLVANRFSRAPTIAGLASGETSRGNRATRLTADDYGDGEPAQGASTR